MATFNLDRQTLDTFNRRVNALSPNTQRLWGKMDVLRMMRHLTFTLDMSLGNVDVKPVSPVFVRPLIYLVFFNWFTTWPKGRIKGPDFVCPPPEGDFASERDLLLRRMREFVDQLESQPGRVTVNPGLGPCKMTKWSRVHGVHNDHHLRQFGV